MPASIIIWIVASMIDGQGSPVWSVPFVLLPFGAIWMARSSVNAYLATFDESSRPRTPEGLVQFTPGYFDFHAGQRGFRALPYKVAFYLLSAVIVLGWLSLWILPLLDI